VIARRRGIVILVHAQHARTDGRALRALTEFLAPYSASICVLMSVYVSLCIPEHNVRAGATRLPALLCALHHDSPWLGMEVHNAD
jgi:hypothetical protein